jgi:4-hydroxy-2-oxoheptanedioate aldolase
MVPMVDNAEQAREIVAWSRFPPVGRRGLGSPFTPQVSVERLGVILI